LGNSRQRYFAGMISLTGAASSGLSVGLLASLKSFSIELTTRRSEPQFRVSLRPLRGGGRQSILPHQASRAGRRRRNHLPHSSDNGITRATASLPGLEIEIVHRRPQGDDLEALSINLQAMPSFEAFADSLRRQTLLCFGPKSCRWHGCLGSEQAAR
jgi:hypothetical protein